MDAKSLVRVFQNIAIPVRDFVYPPVCFICDRYLNKSEEYICDLLLETIFTDRFITPDVERDFRKIDFGRKH